MSRFPATKCSECGTVYGHQLEICRECNAESLVEFLINGTGTVYAKTTIRVPGTAFQDEAPYEVYLVDVGNEESVRVTARLTGIHDLNPDETVKFVEKRDSTFYFESIE